MLDQDRAPGKHTQRISVLVDRDTTLAIAAESASVPDWRGQGPGGWRGRGGQRTCVSDTHVAGPARLAYG